jgi:hypothetical protein
MVMIAHPFAGGELLEQSAVEAAGRMQNDILDDGGLAQLCLAQPAGEALVLAAGCLAVDQEAEPFALSRGL